MLAKLMQHAKPLAAGAINAHSHVLVVLPKAKTLPAATHFPGAATLQRLLKRRGMKPDELAQTPVAGDLEEGTLAVWVMLDGKQNRFEQATALRKALQLLLAEHPQEMAIVVTGSEVERLQAAELAAYVAWVNGAPMPSHKKKQDDKPLKKIHLYGFQSSDGFAAMAARAEGNALCRQLTLLAPNELTPKLYRGRIAALAAECGWKRTEYDLKKLRKLGAGAFVAVAQGSDDDQAAIVHLAYRAKGAQQTVALVGKGICFDTGGHNLKTDKHMYGMHEDMNGSAVALGILLAATRLKFPVNIDCWLALAQNHIGPKAYKQNDVVRALNGTSIEIVHTDAEGRMVLADTLALAAREKPALMLDFATLTGAMVYALGTRYSGVISNREALISQAIAAGKASGERVNPFPFDADYDVALESKVADTKQCAAEGAADHIVAARFLSKFVDDTPWVHMDLSASSCEDGLGALAGRVSGFGVGWGVAMLEAMQRGKTA